MADNTRYACAVCDRADLALTANGRVRSHAANGKRASETNPHCLGGSDWPKHGHDFPVCSVCGVEDMRPTAEELRDAEFVLCSPAAPDEVFDAAEETIRMAENLGVRPVAAPLGAATGGPNPHRPPLTTGSEAQDRARGIPASTPVATKEVASADSFMDGEGTPDEERSPRYFPAKYDGNCDTCGRDFDAGDNIRAVPGIDRAWEGEDCCGGGIDEEAGQRPQSTAPQLPVRNGRYSGPNPDTGKPATWMRTTTFAGAIADSFALTLWQLRMAGMGLAVRPDLLRKIENILQAEGTSAYEVAKSQREILNTIMEDAKLAAGSKDRARKGTILHKHTQEIDMGRKSLGDVPGEFRASVNAYLKGMTDCGFECIPDLIERSTLCASLKVAGTFDRVLRVTRTLDPVVLDGGRTVQLHEGDHVIGDVKSGQDLSYAWGEILIQESVYAHGVDETGVAVPDHSPQGKVVWRWADIAEFGIPNLRTDVGIVMHMPYGESTCDLYYADLITGWRGAKISQNVIDYRKTKMPETPIASYSVKAEKIFTPAGGQVKPTTPPAEGLVSKMADAVVAGFDPEFHAPAPKRRKTWEEVAAAVRTPDEANKVWTEMRKRSAELGMQRINDVTKIMRETLAGKGALRT